MMTLQKRQTRSKLPPINQAPSFVPKRIGFVDDAHRVSVGISPTKKSTMNMQAAPQFPLSVNKTRRLLKTSYIQFADKSSSDDLQTTTTGVTTSGVGPISDVISPQLQGRASKQLHRRNIAALVKAPRNATVQENGLPKKSSSCGEVTQDRETTNASSQYLTYPANRRRYLSSVSSPLNATTAKAGSQYDSNTGGHLSKSNSSRNSRRTQKSMTEIMMERWLKAINTIPDVDREDVYDENPRVNQNAASRKSSDKVRQVEPEFTQSSYLSILQIERNTRAQNYLQVHDANVDVQDQQGHGDAPAKHTQSKADLHEKPVTLSSRNYGIQRIFFLHDQKQYKRETLFIACTIFDRYIAQIGAANFDQKEVITLATISVLMSAKLEQPISPNFNRMIALLTPSEQLIVKKPKLIDLEQQILTKFGFDLNFSSPMQAFERYLRILNYDQNQRLVDLVYQISKYQLTEPHFLNYDPSIIAAAATIISINIYERDSEKRGISQANFFEGSQHQNGAKNLLKPGLLQLNLDIWNNQKVHKITGYSLADIQDCLYHMAVFVAFNLQPNCLGDFDIENVKSVQSYYGYSKLALV